LVWYYMTLRLFRSGVTSSVPREPQSCRVYETHLIQLIKFFRITWKLHVVCLLEQGTKLCRNVDHHEFGTPSLEGLKL